MELDVGSKSILKASLYSLLVVVEVEEDTTILILNVVVGVVQQYTFRIVILKRHVLGVGMVCKKALKKEHDETLYMEQLDKNFEIYLPVQITIKLP